MFYLFLYRLFLIYLFLFFYSFVPYFMLVILDCCVYLRLELGMITAGNLLNAGQRIFVGTTCFKMFASRFKISKSELIFKSWFCLCGHDSIVLWIDITFRHVCVHVKGLIYEQWVERRQQLRDAFGPLVLVCRRVGVREPHSLSSFVFVQEWWLLLLL